MYKEITALRPAWAEIRESDGTSQLTEAEKRDLKPIETIKMVSTRQPFGIYLAQRNIAKNLTGNSSRSIPTSKSPLWWTCVIGQ